MTLDILLAFGFGVLYGYRHPGKEDRMGLMKSGAKWGLMIGLVFGGLDFLATSNIPRWIGMTIGGLIGIIFLTIVFVVGTVLGDFLEVKLKK